MKKNLDSVVFFLALCGAIVCTPVAALDGVSLEAGGGSGIRLWRAGAQWSWERKWFTGGRWHLGGYWDAQLGGWHDGNDIADVSLTPVFRLQESARSGLSPYVEAAIGVHLLSDKQITPTKRFGSSFQFGDHLGVGVRFGERGRHDLGLRLQHLSNAGLKDPNPGINLWQIRYQRHFD
jgi:hypothetical protein